MNDSCIEITFTSYQTFSFIRLMLKEFLDKNLLHNSPLIELAVNEAVNNALKHGKKNGRQGKVSLKLNKINNKILIRVKDQGPGFSIADLAEKFSVPPCEMFESMLNDESGRGILVMRAAADKLIFNRQGNEVMMIKNC